jgi:hypothetical protein
MLNLLKTKAKKVDVKLRAEALLQDVVKAWVGTGLLKKVTTQRKAQLRFASDMSQKAWSAKHFSLFLQDVVHTTWISSGVNIKTQTKGEVASADSESLSHLGKFLVEHAAKDIFTKTPNLSSEEFLQSMLISLQAFACDESKESDYFKLFCPFIELIKLPPMGRLTLMAPYLVAVKSCQLVNELP